MSDDIFSRRPLGPTCPVCGSKPMQLRTAKSGPKKGNQFYGCLMFPDCRGTLPKAAGDKITAVEAEAVKRAKIERFEAEVQDLREKDLDFLAGLDL